MPKKALIIGGILLFIVAITAFVGLGTVTEEAVEVVEMVTRRGYTPPTFVGMGRYVIPVIRRDRVETQLSVAIALETVSEDETETVREAMPRLRDAFIADLHKAVLWQQRESGDVISLGPIKKRLKIICDSILGPGVVNEVLIGGALQRNFAID